MRKTVIGMAMLTGIATAWSGLSPATASSGGSDEGARVGYVKNLKAPFNPDVLGRQSFVLAEQGANQVTIIGKHGAKRALVKGAAGVSGVATRGKYVYSVIAGPNEEGPAPAGRFKPTSVLRTKIANGKTTVIANLEAYELKHNPDGQAQFGPGHVPYDALSNPFSIASTKYGLLVADGGANDVLRINPRTGKVSTFFVPPTVKLSGCEQSNPGTTGCDPVPTGVVQHGRSVYVSTLGAFTPGAGRIYKLNARTGKVQRVWGGLFAPVGIAVGKDRSIYYGGIATNQVFRVHGGKTTSVTFTSPSGLVISRNKLFAASAQAGVLMRIRQSSFK